MPEINLHPGLFEAQQGVSDQYDLPAPGTETLLSPSGWVQGDPDCDAPGADMEDTLTGKDTHGE